MISIVLLVLVVTLFSGVIITGNFDPNINVSLPRKSFANVFGNVSTENMSGEKPELLENNHTLEVKVNKNRFEAGEAVIITVRNSGVGTLTFPDSALGLMIQNVVTKERFGFFAAQVLTSLKPGESKSIKWDQRGLDGTQVDMGRYTVSVSTIPDQNLSPLSADSYFEIDNNSK
jgi:hypothetical protein